MHTLSSISIPLTDTIFAKLMWRNAFVVETLLALGATYRSIRGGSEKRSSIDGNHTNSSSSKSASGKMTHIHSSKGMNHHFKVFQVLVLAVVVYVVIVVEELRFI